MFPRTPAACYHRNPVSLSGKVEALTAEKTKQVRVEYQHKLSSLQLELKMQVAKKEHAKMVINNSHTEKQLKTLQHDLLELKKTKVRMWTPDDDSRAAFLLCQW